MKFDNISSSIGRAEKNLAQEKLQGLALELGVRHDNEHVGSGLGGNNPQLVALMSFHHELTKDPITIECQGGTMRWGYVWLSQSKRRALRAELDAKLPVSKDRTLQDVQDDTQFSSGPNVRSWDTLRTALQTCAGLASDLDKGVETKIGATASALKGNPMEVNLVAIRTQIQIDRLVRHNLDEHPEFSKILFPINKAVDD